MRYGGQRYTAAKRAAEPTAALHHYMEWRNLEKSSIEVRSFIVASILFLTRFWLRPIYTAYIIRRTGFDSLSNRTVS